MIGVRWGLLLLLAVPARAQERFLGYTPAATRTQATVERRLQSLVRADSLSALHAPLAARPHPAGSAGSREVIDYLARTLRSFGLEVERQAYEPWLSHPRRVEVALTAPVARRLSVREPPMAADPSSSHPELGDGYIAYSASGDVQGAVVYANYGLPADYAELARHGVTVRDRIVVVRYGRSHRAVKVYTAQEAGARAVVLYSDPADDGFVKGTPWPEGYWRAGTMLQRGNAKLSWYFHGDPLTPGVAATPDAPRLDPATAPTLPRIPVVALGWEEARHLLSALGGPEAPSPFVGGVPGITYRLGPGPATARVTVEMDDRRTPIANVVATLRGRGTPERTILLGGHHDAWTFGAVDPGTGAAALLELARVLGTMARGGWRPNRTIQIAFWDAEEFGLVGSTEHAEAFRRELQDRLALYVNIDMYMRGRFDPGGVPSLRDFVAEVARGVPIADGGTVHTQWTGALAPGTAPDLKALGSGADFVPFQDHLAVPTLAIEFIGANGYGFGTYHTNYDSRAYVERVADPGFRQGVTMVQVLGTLALRMANAPVLPFRYSHYAAKLRAAVDDADRALGASPPARGMRARVDRVAAHADSLERQLDRRLARRPLAASVARQLNDRLARVEQLLADDAGAPDRRWYRHVFHGWNIYSLYDGQLFPGLHDAIRRQDADRIDAEVRRIEQALDRMAGALARAHDLVRSPAP